MITISTVSKLCALVIVVSCAYMATVDPANQLVWVVALVGWISQVFD